MRTAVRRDHGSRHAREAGFSLVELLIAIVVLLVGIAAVAELVPVALESNFRNRNDSTALIAAQRLLEQMARQPVDARLLVGCPDPAPATPAPPATHYGFCDRDGDPIGLGQIVNLGNANTQDGCPLDATGQQLDFTVACAAPGYRVVKQWVWNPTTNTMQNVELRWAVITRHISGYPRRKVFVVGARTGGAVMGGQATPQGFVITNLQTVVAPQ